MPKWVWISVVVCALLVVVQGCEKEKKKAVEATVAVAQQSQKPDYVRFDVKPDGKQTSNHWRYQCRYAKDGVTARFSIELNIEDETFGHVPVDSTQLRDKPHVQLKPENKEFKFKSGRGSIIADPDSDDSVLLQDLQVALEGKRAPSKGIRIHELPFEFAVLGENMMPSEGNKADLVDSDNGKWVATKLFIGPSQEETQVFFNFEAGGGKGEFSLKDPVYGADLLKELAKVL